MNASRLWIGVAAVGLLAALAPPPAHAQVATIRGKIIDAEGNPVPNVQIHMTYKGEQRNIKDKDFEADDSGGYVMGGLISGNWQITYKKEGWKTYDFETYISLGGISEIPDLTLEPLPAPTPTPVPTPEPQTIQEHLKEEYDEAIAKIEEGKEAEGEAQLKKILETAPNAAIVHYQLGSLYLKQERNEEAEQALRQAIWNAPDVAESYLALAALLGTQGKSQDAFDLLQGAAERFPGDSRFHFTLAINASNAGNDAAALAAFEKVAELDPSHAETQYYLGTLAISAGDNASALEHLERYLELEPDGPNAETAKGIVSYLKK